MAYRNSLLNRLSIVHGGKILTIVIIIICIIWNCTDDAREQRPSAGGDQRQGLACVQGHHDWAAAGGARDHARQDNQCSTGKIKKNILFLK